MAILTVPESKSKLDILIEDLSRDLIKPFADIVEVTYAYAKVGEGKYVNKTIFGDFIGLKPDSNDDEKVFWLEVSENIKEIYNQTLIELQTKQKLLGEYKVKIIALGQLENPKIKILLGTLDYLEKIINLTITGLPFEAEKAGMTLDFSETDRQERIKKLEEIEVSLFGPLVRNNQYEIDGSFKALKKLYEDKNALLTEEERGRFLGYLGKIKEKVSTERDEQKVEAPKISEQNSQDILNKDIPRDDYVKVLQIVMDIYGIDKPIKVEERSSIYDGEDYLGIPSSDGYKTLKLQRILQLIQHEIEVHYIISENNSRVLGDFRGAGNLQREEGTAKVSEWIIKGKTLDDFAVGGAISDILMGEILSGDEYRDYLDLFSKLDKDEMRFGVALKDPAGLYLRRKRNYPLSTPGVQHKDTSYNRGELQVVEFLRNGGDVKDLFVSKVSFDDIAYAKEIASKNEIKLNYPLLLGELLQYMLLLSGNKFSEKDFWDYIESKYPFLNFRQEFVDGKVKRLTESGKLKILRILKILGK